MQQQERDLITDLYGRLKPFEAQPRDPEAERLIAGLVAQQPAAPYLLTQTVLVQEEALKAAQARIAELEGQAQPAQGGFLANAPRVGPWGAKAAMPAPQQQALPASPWQRGGAPQQPGGSGSFLRSAMATAAGVAGGALLFQGISSLMGSHGGPFGSAAQAAPLQPPDRFSGAEQGYDNNRADDGFGASSDDSSGFDSGGFDSGGSDDL